jgi:uncharacterized protein (DUF1330 family)
MPAYVLLNGRYFAPDRTAMRAYAERAPAVLAAYGGRYCRSLAHRVEVLEGAWHPRALGMLEFPTFAQARAWYDSPEYAPLKAIRLAQARNDTILLDALAADQPLAAGPARSDAERAQLRAFLAEAERRGVPPDRFRPGEPVEAVVPAAAAESPAAVAFDQVMTLLPALDRAGRRRLMEQCRDLDAAAGDEGRP